MDKTELSKSDNKLFGRIAELLSDARKFAVVSVNKAIVLTYYEVGRLIIEDEQKGKERAEYGKSVLKELSTKLTKEFGKGYSVYNLERMRKFYSVYSKSATALRKLANENSSSLLRKSDNPFKLSWSHYLQLIKIDSEQERKFYEIESANNNWSVRELERQYDSSLYERLVLSRDKNAVKELSEKGQLISKPSDAIKDNYLLSF